MGEQIELLCSETSLANDGKNLNEIFVNRFQLPASFWNDLLDSNCPEGLGKVNEKLKNGDDLAANDFKCPDEYSINDEGQHSKNEQNGIKFKTPILVKSLSNASHSPSLFSPLPQDYNISKGPSSSTPLPGKSVQEAAFTITPKTTKNDGKKFFTPEHKLLNFTPYDTKTKTKKLSASLAMDLSEQMNLSWSSSLATPPGPGCLKQQSVNSENDQSCIQGACSFERSAIPWQELDTIRMENPSEQLDTVKVKVNSKPKPRGVARILFEEELKSFREDIHANIDHSFENSEAFRDDSTYKKPNEVAQGCSLNHFDMSSLSPLQDKVINELFALTDTRKSLTNTGNSSEGMKKKFNVNKNVMNIREKKLTPEKAFSNAVQSVHEENHANDNFSSDCMKEHANEAYGIDADADNIKAGNKDVKNNDFENLIDMDTLSEFLNMDCDLSHYPSTSDQIEKTHPVYDSVKSDNDDKTKGLHVDVSEILQTTSQQFNNEVNKSERKLITDDSAYDMDALSEFPMDIDLSQLINVPSTSNQREKVHSQDSKSNNNNQGLINNNVGSHSVSNEESPKKSSHKSQFIDVSKIPKTDELIVSNKMNKPEAKPLNDDNVYDMDALSELPIDMDDLCQPTRGISPAPDNCDCSKLGELINKRYSDVPVEQNRSSAKKLVTTSQVLQPASLPLFDIATDKHVESNANLRSRIISLTKNADDKEVKKNLAVRSLEDERNDKLKIVNCFDMRSCQNVNSLQPFEGFSTASGKKLTISERSMQRARKLLSEVNKTDVSPEISGTINVNAGVSAISRKKVGDPIGKSQYNKAAEELFDVGFCTASGKKVDVSVQSLKKARQIVNDVIQEETRCVKRSVETAGTGVAPALRRKFEVPTFSGVDTNEETGSVTSHGKQRQNTGNTLKFSTASGKEIRISEKSLMEAKSILGDVQHMPELSDDFIQDVEKVLADLEKESCPSKGGNIQGMNEDERVRVNRGTTCAEEEKNLDNVEHVPGGNNDNSYGNSVKPDNVNHGLLSTCEKDLTLFEESLKKVPKPNELDGKQSGEVPSDHIESQIGTPQNNVAGKSHSVQEINMMPNVVLNAPDSIPGDAETEKTSKNSFSIPNSIVHENTCKTMVLEDEDRHIISKTQGIIEIVTGIRLFTASDKNAEISQDSVKLGKQIIKEINIGKIDGQEMNELLEKKNTASVVTTASGNKVTFSGEILSNIANEHCPEERGFNEIEKFGFSTASGKTITISEESMKKAQRILNEVNKEEQCQKKVVNGKQNIALTNTALRSEPKGFTFLENNVKTSEALIQKTSLDNNKSKECCKSFGNEQFSMSSTSHNGVTVPVELLRESQTTVNEVDIEERKPTNGNKVSCSTETVENKPVGLTTASGKNVSVSEVSIQRAKSMLSDKESDNFSKKEGSLSKFPKFAFSTASGKGITVSEESVKKAAKILSEVGKEEHESKDREVNEKIGFCTVSGNKIAVSKESLQKAQNILNEVDDEKYQKEKTASNVIHKTNATSANVGFVTASGSNVAVSEESIQKVKRMLGSERNEEERSLIKTTKFGFCTASGYKIEVSKEAVKNAQRILNEADNKQTELNQKMGKVDASTGKNVQNYTKTANLLDNSNSINYKSGVQLASIFQNDIARLGSSCDKTNSTPKQTEENENDIDYRKTHKRLSSEFEIEDGRACKASRIDKETETKGVKGKWTRFKSFDPLVAYKDRKGSSSNTPSRTDLENINQVPCVQPDDVKTPTNSKFKVGSHFVTPYRVIQSAAKQGKLLERSPSSSKKTKGTKQNIKARSVKPQPGSMYNLKTNACFKSKRISFAEYVCSVNQQTHDEPKNHGINPSVKSVTCENASSYRFKGSDFLSEDLAAENTGVTCTEGAVLFLGEDKCVGLPEFTKAFLSSPGVDPKLISQEWIANHYKWIVWKLASYEKSYPQSFSGRALTPDILLCQLKYRYDREIDHCERSAIKKILERDDSSSRSMVLCVSSLDETDSDTNNESKSNSRSRNVERQKVILMTDGWYSIRVKLDEYLQNLMKERKIYIGQKLYIQGAELCGSDQAVSPLEAPSDLHLRIHGNSTRPAKKFSRLGFHCKNNVFTVPIKSISTVGGLVGSINVIVVRQYPLQFMEKLPDGKCIFRNPRCEERIAKKFEKEILRKREKIMLQVEKEIENEEKKPPRGTKGRKSNCLSTNQIENLCDGKQIFDAISNASDPLLVQKCLSDEQRRNLDHYKEDLNNDRASIVRRKYEEAWSKLSEEETLKRDVIAVLKVKLVDCFPSKANQAPGTALLTVWRPSEQTITMLGERKRLKIYNLYVSKYKGNNTMQLTANRSTIYNSLPSDGTFQNTFDGRKVFTFQEISNGLRPNVEVDVVAVVISQFCQHNLTLVFVADSNFNLVRIKVWGGLESQGLQDVMRVKNFVAACNLLSQPDKRSGIPSLKYYELSLVTSNPSNKMLRNSLYELRKNVPNIDSFITKAKAKLDELCSSNWSTPKVQTMSLLNTTSSEFIGKRRRTTETPPTLNKEIDIKVVSNNFTPLSSTMNSTQNESLLQSRKRLLQSKRRKLELLGDPPPLSPIPNALPTSVRKAFQVPRRVKTRVDDTENEEE